MVQRASRYAAKSARTSSFFDRPGMSPRNPGGLAVPRRVASRSSVFREDHRGEATVTARAPKFPQVSSSTASSVVPSAASLSMDLDPRATADLASELAPFGAGREGGSLDLAPTTMENRAAAMLGTGGSTSGPLEVLSGGATQVDIRSLQRVRRAPPPVPEDSQPRGGPGEGEKRRSGQNRPAASLSRSRLPRLTTSPPTRLPPPNSRGWTTAGRPTCSTSRAPMSRRRVGIKRAGPRLRIVPARARLYPRPSPKAPGWWPAPPARR